MNPLSVGSLRTFELGLRRHLRNFNRKWRSTKSEFLNETVGRRADFTGEEFAAIKQFVEWRDRATAPATTAASMENAPAPSTSMGIFMPSTVPELRGRENLGTFLKRFRT